MNRKRSLAFLLAALMCLSLCACGNAKSAQTSYKDAAYEMSAAAVPAPMQANAAYDMAYEGEGFGMMNMATGSSASRGSDSGSKSEVPEENPEKIIYSGDATIETTDFEKSIAALEAMIAEAGGFVQSSSVNGNNYYDSSRGYTSKRSASYTLRVPSEKFAVLMNSLSDIGNVPYTYTYTENVTAEYYDVQARLTALQAQEKRLLEMMEIAETVEDIIILEDRLTEVRYTIDSLQSSLNNWDRQVSYSTVYLDLSEVQEYRPEPQVQPSYGQQLLSALKEGLHDAGSFFKALLLGIAGSLPFLVFLAIVIVVIVLLVKRTRKRREAKRAAKKAAQTPPPPQPAEATGKE